MRPYAVNLLHVVVGELEHLEQGEDSYILRNLLYFILVETKGAELQAAYGDRRRRQKVHSLQRQKAERQKVHSLQRQKAERQEVQSIQRQNAERQTEQSCRPHTL